MLDLVGERVESGRVFPEPRQQLDEHAERIVGAVREERPRLAALEEQRVPRVVAAQEPHRAVSVPALERVGLLLGLAVRMADLQHRRRAVGELHPDDAAPRRRPARTARRA